MLQLAGKQVQHVHVLLGWLECATTEDVLSRDMALQLLASRQFGRHKDLRRDASGNCCFVSGVPLTHASLSRPLMASAAAPPAAASIGPPPVVPPAASPPNPPTSVLLFNQHLCPLGRPHMQPAQETYRKE